MAHRLRRATLVEGDLDALRAVRLRGLDVEVLDRTRRIRGIAVAREDAAGGDVVLVEQLLHDHVKRRPLLEHELADVENMAPRHDEEVAPRPLLGRHGVRPRAPAVVLEHDVVDLRIELPAEGASPFEEPIDELDVVVVRARTRGHGTLCGGEPRNEEERCEGQDCTGTRVGNMWPPKSRGDLSNF